MSKRDQQPALSPPLTPAVFHVLLALSEEPQHGYAIMRAVEETSGTEMGPGTIYGTLQRLEESGLIEERHDESSRRRRIFGLLPEGRAVLRAESRRLADLADLVRARDLATRG